MKPRAIANLFNVLIFILIADSAFGDPGFSMIRVAQPSKLITPVISLLLFPPDVSSKLITPYVNETNMTDIRVGFSSDKTSPPWNFVHDGLDIYPNGNLKPFQAVCSGRVHWMYTGDEQVIVMLACNSTYTVEYNFETQAPGTGQTQLANIEVVKGQAVSQGDIIGYLYAPNQAAHLHFTLHKNWIPSCPESHFSIEARNSILNLLHETFSDADMCYGSNPDPPPLITPYLNESDMTKIDPGFSSEYSTSPWGFVHDGIDIYPQGALKPFRASCSGTVDTVELRQPSPGSNWQVEVLIQCDDYVDDPDDGGYFIPFSVDYIFEPMSNDPIHGETQLKNIAVHEGDAVSQGDMIGSLYVAGSGAHVQFGLVQYGSSFYSAMGVPSIPLCPEPHFYEGDKNSIMNLLYVVWPNADMCYQN